MLTHNQVNPRLGEIVTELISLHHELATLLIAERNCKMQAWAVTEGSESLRNKAADYQALNLTGDIFRIRGDIAALTEERDYLILLMKLGAGMGVE